MEPSIETTRSPQQNTPAASWARDRARDRVELTAWKALSRRRDNPFYADLRIMPMSGPKALVVAVSVVVRSA